MQFFDIHQGARQIHGMAASGDGIIITAKFPLFPYSCRNPPDCWIIKKEHLHQGLEEIDQGIPAEEMGHLMGQDDLDLFRRQRGQKGEGQEQGLPEKADNRRGVHPRRQINRHQALHLPLLQPYSDPLLPLARQRVDGPVLQ